MTKIRTQGVHHITMARFKFAPPAGCMVADVLSAAHRLRVEAGDYAIADKHLADAIAERTERRAPALAPLQPA